MIRNSMREIDRQNDPLLVGDKVRVDLDVFVAHRKMSSFEKRAKKVNNWSKNLYTVVDIDEKADGNKKYKVIDNDGDPPVEGHDYHRRTKPLPG